MPRSSPCKSLAATDIRLQLIFLGPRVDASKSRPKNQSMQNPAQRKSSPQCSDVVAAADGPDGFGLARPVITKGEGELPCIGLGLGLPSQTSCSVTVSGQQFPSLPHLLFPVRRRPTASFLTIHPLSPPPTTTLRLSVRPFSRLSAHRLDSLSFPPRHLRPRAPSALDDFVDEVAACRIPQGRLKTKTANVWLPKASAAQSGMSSSSLIPAHPTPLPFFMARRLVATS